MSEWKPIDLAPRDGAEFLVENPEGIITQVCWYNNPFGDEDTVMDRRTGRWWTVARWTPKPEQPAHD